MYAGDFKAYAHACYVVDMDIVRVDTLLGRPAGHGLLSALSTWVVPARTLLE